MSTVEGGLKLLSDVSSKERRQCIETLITIFRNVSKEPNNVKYSTSFIKCHLHRTLKVKNERFFNEVWNFPGARVILDAAGWVLKQNVLELPPNIVPTTALQILLSNRAVKPDEEEWVEGTKLIIPNALKVREAELREKALAEKERQMKELKKDMIERKAIAKCIKAEHSHDIEERHREKESTFI